MASVEYRGVRAEVADGETALAALERVGAPIPRGCRRGICGACLVRVRRGTVAAEAQRGLSPAQAAMGLAFACLTKPTDDLALEEPGRGVEHTARVVALDPLSADVRRVRLAANSPLAYSAGQYVVLARPDGEERSYSLASVPSDGALELHVRRVPGGAVSGWIFDELRPGDAVRLRGPLGNCCYAPGRPQQPLLLVGTGTGLAPLWGIVRDALAHGHTGPIDLYHGARTTAGLYFRDELEALEERCATFRYHPCVLEGPADRPRVRVGALEAIALSDHPTTAGRRVFLCGDAPLVRALKRRFFLNGTASRDLLADPFEPVTSMERRPCT
jgi:CDP-4-dehydro-6-deoxyglucose reductase, E3